jgi:enterochelin esterase-like enzyme
VGLNSAVTVALAVLLALACLTAAVLGWPKLATGGVRSVLGRIGTVLLCQLTGLAAVGLVVNNRFDFYSSWSDLLGTANSKPLADRTLTGDALIKAVDRQYADPASVKGRVVNEQVAGSASGVTTSINVYLPPQYDAPGNRDETFPVALVISGYPGDLQSLISGMRTPQTLDGLVAKGRVLPMVVVMVSPTVDPPRDTECADVSGGPQVETFLSQDLPGYVRQHYRVEPAGRRWGVAGVSTGGFCAVKLAMRHPGVFGSAASISGYLHPVIDQTTGKLYPSDQVKLQNDPLWRLRNLELPKIHVLLTGSHQEPSVYGQLTQFATESGPPMSVDTLVIEDGGHNFGVWTSEYPTCLQWLSSRLSN